MITVRASSLSDFLDCPLRWKAKHIEKKTLPASGRARLGTSIHAGTALFDRQAIDNIKVSVDDAMGATAEKLWRKDEEEVKWTDDLSQGKAEEIALDLTEKYCRRISPQQGFIEVEKKCECIEITDLNIALTGTLDRIYTDNAGAAGIMDIKSSGSIVGPTGEVKTSGHMFQLEVYRLLASSLGYSLTAPAKIVGLQTAKTRDARRVGIGIIDSSLETLIGDEFTKGPLEMVANMLSAGLFPPNPRSMLCSGKFCPTYVTCKYRA